MVRVDPTLLYSTYSIVAHDETTGQYGIAVQTHQIGVGRIVIWMQPGYGAVITQASANISFGPMALAMLREGLGADSIVKALVASDAMEARRQLAVVDGNGVAAAHTGALCIPEANHHLGDGYSVQANMMTRSTVIDAMRNAFESAEGDLAARMMQALHAAQAEDGDIRGKQSAALKVVSGNKADPAWATVYDLRVDEADEPVMELDRLVRLRHSQLMDGEGYALMHQGNFEEALQRWQAARERAPELEETAFWQALRIADAKPDAINEAVRIFNEAFADDPRREHWIDLIRRLHQIEMFERSGTADELLAAIEKSS